MRNVAGSLNNTTAGTESQFLTVASPRVFSATFKAKAKNANSIYIAGSSALSSVNSFELGAGESFSLDYSTGNQQGSVKGTNFWMLGDDTSQVCDFWFVTED